MVHKQYPGAFCSKKWHMNPLFKHHMDVKEIIITINKPQILCYFFDYVCLSNKIRAKEKFSQNKKPLAGGFLF